MVEFKGFSKMSKLYANHYGLIEEAEEKFYSEFSNLMEAFRDRIQEIRKGSWEIEKKWETTKKENERTEKKYYFSLSRKDADLLIYLWTSETENKGVIEFEGYTKSRKKQEKERFLNRLKKEAGFEIYKDKGYKEVDLLKDKVVEECTRIVGKFMRAVGKLWS